MERILKDKEAVIFDMDGVLVESEGLWKQAEFEVFSSLGVLVTEKGSQLTRSMTTKEVTRFWHEQEERSLRWKRWSSKGSWN